MEANEGGPMCDMESTETAAPDVHCGGCFGCGALLALILAAGFGGMVYSTTTLHREKHTGPVTARSAAVTKLVGSVDVNCSILKRPNGEAFQACFRLADPLLACGVPLEDITYRDTDIPGVSELVKVKMAPEPKYDMIEGGNGGKGANHSSYDQDVTYWKGTSD